MSTRRRSNGDFADEIDAHLALEVERLIDDGMSPEEARAAARRSFGNVTAARERFYESGRSLFLDQLRQDVRAGLRSLMRYPVAALVAIISLAGGIGAVTATLTIRDVVFHRPPPLYREPSELSRVQVGSPEHPIRPTGNLVPGRLFAAWQDADFSATLAGAAPAHGRDVRAGDRTETVRVRSVTPDFFSVLGVDPALGRSPSEPISSAVLSHRVWQMLFDGRPDAIGSVIWIDHQPFTVTGVMPERFWFSTIDSLIWTPVPVTTVALEDNVEVVARRRAGMSPDVLERQLQRGLVEYASHLPADERQLEVKVSGIEGTPLGRSLPLALPWLLGVSVLLTLLIACANVAILVIAQWTTREHEIAIRASLGASRGRVIRTLVTESILIAGIGGLLGVCVTLALRGIIVHHAGSGVQMLDLSFSPRILIESFVIMLFSGAIAGIGPALLETRRLHGNPMRALSSSDRVRQRWRQALVVMEIAVTVALLVVTGGMLTTYERQLTTDVGFKTRPLVRLRVENSAGLQVDRFADAVSEMRGVSSVAPSTSIPYASNGPLEQVSADRSGSTWLKAEHATIGPGFFTTLDVPLRAGRMFTRTDSIATRTAIINEALAARLFADKDPIGQRLWLQGTDYEVVGVVAQYANQALQPHQRDPKVYLPFDESRSVDEADFLIRTSSDPAALVRTLRREVRNIAAGTAVTSAYTIDEIIAVSGQEILVGTAPLVPLIAIGMLLTAAGIYGVLAFAITRRSTELAVRIAIGATGRQVARLVTVQSLHLIAIGAGLGVGFTFAASRIVRASGGEGSFMDPAWPAFVIPILIVIVIAAVATWAPSRRALRINPATLLRV